MLRKKILIVEDDQDIREVLSELLVNEGFNVICAENGKIGIDLLLSQEELPHVVLLDLMMPVMDGFEFCKEKQSHIKFNQIPVILMTADGQVLEKQKRANAQAYLKKPLDLYKILDTIGGFVGHQVEANP